MNIFNRRFTGNSARISLYFLLLYLLAGGLFLPSLHAYPGEAGTSATVEPFSDLPPGSAPAIAKAMLEDLPEEYQLQENGKNFSLSNPSHGMDIAFTADGLQVKSGDKSWGMAMTGIGSPGSVKPVQKAVLINDNGRMVYQRGDVSEWYINSPWGVEQGFTVRKAPAGKDRSGLVVEISLSGTVLPSLDADTLVLADAQGDGIARYTGLQVFDADNKSLPAHLALAGSTLRILVDDAHARYPVTIDPWIQQAKLTASDGYGSDAFGSSIAISGDTIVVGADGDDSAYVFAQPVSGWTGNMTQTAKLNLGVAAGAGWRDNPVAISGDTIVVGEANGADNPGSAYVFVRPVSGWTGYMDQTVKLTPSDGAQFKNFGYSVAISGDTIVVGARYDNNIKGSVYVFVKPSSGWTNMTQTAKLAASDGAEGDSFGLSVAISGDTIVVGACSYYNYQGSAYVFVKPSSGWRNMTETAKLTTSGTVDYFGRSVAISGDTIVVGASFYQEYHQVSVHVFVKPSSGWRNMIQTALLTTSDGALFKNFASSVAISDGMIVVGTPDGDGKGSAYVFARPDSGWRNMTETAKITARDGAEGDAFGSSVAISGGTIVVGAEGDYSGSAYVFKLGAAVINTEQWRLLLDNGQGYANLTLSLKQDRTVTADGNWEYIYQGAKNFGSFTKAPVTISGKSISLTATGTATNPSAPPGYTTSPYTGVFSGTAFDGQGSGTFSVTFQAYGWPRMLAGVWQGTRTGGSGITAVTPVKTKVLPWLMLLLND